jgi:hypothetical protein
MYKWPNRCSQLRYRASAIPTTGTLAPVQDYSAPYNLFLLLKKYSSGLPVGLLRLLGLGDPGEWGVPEAGVQLVHRGQQLRVDLPTV